MRCINRNIVECKVLYPYVFMCFPDVLIETSWNVKERGNTFSSVFPMY